MAFLKAAVLFALVAISLQPSEASPCLLGELLGDVVDHAKDRLQQVEDQKQLFAIADKAKETLEAVVEAKHLRPDQSKEVYEIVQRDAQNGKLSGLAAVDLALKESVKNGIITDKDKVKILISGIRAGDHKTEASSLKAGMAAVLKSAVEADVISEETAEKILKNTPQSVKIDARFTTSADDVKSSITLIDDPVGVRSDVRKVVERARQSGFEAAKAGVISWGTAAFAMNVRNWRAAMSNEIDELAKLLVVLDVGIRDNIIDYPTWVKLVQVNSQLAAQQSLPKDWSKAFDKIMDAAVSNKFITVEVSIKLKAVSDAEFP